MPEGNFSTRSLSLSCVVVSSGVVVISDNRCQKSLIPLPGQLKSFDSNSNSSKSKCDKCLTLIPIPILGKSGIILESIPIPELELCITGCH